MAQKKDVKKPLPGLTGASPAPQAPPVPQKQAAPPAAQVRLPPGVDMSWRAPEKSVNKPVHARDILEVASQPNEPETGYMMGVARNLDNWLQFWADRGVAANELEPKSFMGFVFTVRSTIQSRRMMRQYYQSRMELYRYQFDVRADRTYPLPHDIGIRGAFMYPNSHTRFNSTIADWCGGVIDAVAAQIEDGEDEFCNLLASQFPLNPNAPTTEGSTTIYRALCRYSLIVLKQSMLRSLFDHHLATLQPMELAEDTDEYAFSMCLQFSQLLEEVLGYTYPPDSGAAAHVRPQRLKGQTLLAQILGEFVMSVFVPFNHLFWSYYQDGTNTYNRREDVLVQDMLPAAVSSSFNQPRLMMNPIRQVDVAVETLSIYGIILDKCLTPYALIRRNFTQDAVRLSSEGTHLEFEGVDIVMDGSDQESKEKHAP